MINLTVKPIEVLPYERDSTGKTKPGRAIETYVHYITEETETGRILLIIGKNDQIPRAVYAASSAIVNDYNTTPKYSLFDIIVYAKKSSDFCIELLIAEETIARKNKLEPYTLLDSAELCEPPVALARNSLYIPLLLDAVPTYFVNGSDSLEKQIKDAEVELFDTNFNLDSDFAVIRAKGNAIEKQVKITHALLSKNITIAGHKLELQNRGRPAGLSSYITRRLELRKERKYNFCFIRD